MKTSVIKRVIAAGVLLTCSITLLAWSWPLASRGFPSALSVDISNVSVETNTAPALIEQADATVPFSEKAIAELTEPNNSGVSNSTEDVARNTDVRETATEARTVASSPEARPQLTKSVLLKATDEQTDPARIQDISFDDIKFDIEKDGEFKREMLTEKIHGYDDQKIRIRGYILPSFKQNGIKRFILVRDNKECCFGPGAAIYDCIVVTMESGKSTSYTVRPVTVEGTFKIKEFKPADRLLSIYSMKASLVE
jgi:hypothetical protein